MTKKWMLIITITYIVVNSIFFFLTYGREIGTYASINFMFSLFIEAAFNINNDFISSSIYLILTSIVFYGLVEIAKRYELIFTFIVAIVISIPILNLNGL